MTLTEWASENIGTVITIILTFFSIVGGLYKIYYDHLTMKREMLSFQNTTSSLIKGIELAKEMRHKEVDQKFKDQEKMTALEIKNAQLETEKKLAEYRQQNDKRMDDQGKLIQQLLLNTNEIGTNVKHIFETMNEIKDNQKDNQKFREDFLREQATKNTNR